jgi:hypothetical protein
MTPEQLALALIEMAARIAPEVIRALSGTDDFDTAMARARANVPEAITRDEIDAMVSRHLDRVK